MHATVRVHDLRHALKTVRPATVRVARPMLACVRIDSDADRVYLSTTNLDDLSIRTWIPNLHGAAQAPPIPQRRDGAVNGSASPRRPRGWRRRRPSGAAASSTAIVDRSALERFLKGRHSKDATVTLQPDQSVLRMTTATRSVALTTGDPAAWPATFTQHPFTQRPFTQLLGEADTSHLQACWERVAPACCDDASRPVLMGLNLRGQDHTVQVAATDSYRLHILTLPVTTALPQPVDLIVLPRALQIAVDAAMAEPHQRLSVWATLDTRPVTVEVRTARTSIQTREVDGEFPPVARMLPDTSQHATIRVQDATAARTALADLSQQLPASGSVKLGFDDHLVMLSAEATDAWIEADKLPGLTVETGQGPIAPRWFNPRYLAEAITAAGDHGVLLVKPEAAESAMVLRNEHFTGLVMTVRKYE